MSLPSALFDVALARHDGVCLVHLTGELDLASADAFAEWLMHLPDQRIVVDLSELVFIDSSGFGAFVRAKNRATEIDQELVLTRPRRNVERLFDIVGLEGMIGPWRTEWERLGQTAVV